MRRTIYLVLSDSHGGFELGLCNPDTPTGGTAPKLRLTESNMYLWEEIFLPGIQWVQELADGDPIVCAHNGDLAHGAVFTDGMMMSQLGIQFLIAAANFFPLLEIPNLIALLLMSGTPVHDFGQGSVQSVVAEILRPRYPNKKITAYHHPLLTAPDGFTMDCAHKGPPPGKRNWLKGNIAEWYLKSLMMDELDRGNTPPQVVLRSHYHEWLKVWCGIKRDNVYAESWLIITPPLCMLGDWGRQATGNTYLISPGMIALEVIDGQLHQTHFFGQTVDIREKEQIEWDS